ncbi:hypothetical protein HYC85_027987 [Camellia sinensis]|uniref:UspA domain-containing protein n=1 Tax=Camellia sinensis TaxID=4442 RepID=A0A7J7FXU7_CAMSI|nr:hypothetical protein HYC85_027987 [Camellia sinensis]
MKTKKKKKKKRELLNFRFGVVNRSNFRVFKLWYSLVVYIACGSGRKSQCSLWRWSVCGAKRLTMSQSPLTWSRSSVEGIATTTAIAIGTDKNSQFAVKWAVDNLLKKNSIVILVHVKTQSLQYSRYLALSSSH